MTHRPCAVPGGDSHQVSTTPSLRPLERQLVAGVGVRARAFLDAAAEGSESERLPPAVVAEVAGQLLIRRGRVQPATLDLIEPLLTEAVP